MTEQEAKGLIQGKLNCMKKCDVFNCKVTSECENCEYCYSQGTFGEQKTAFETAVKALEKQIPKKPIPVITSDNEFICMICPSCQEIAVDFNDKHCRRCGQNILWSEEE